MEIIKLQKEEGRIVRRKGKPIVSEGLGTGAGGDVKMEINSKGGSREQLGKKKKTNQFWKTQCMNKNFLSNLEKQQQEMGNVCSQLNT